MVLTVQRAGRNSPLVDILPSLLPHNPRPHINRLRSQQQHILNIIILLPSLLRILLLHQA